MLLDSAIERLYALKVDTTTRDGDGTPHEKPHKPLLLLAAFDLIDEGLATPDRIPWCQALRDRFSARFLLVKKLNDRNNPDLPFRYLAGDDLWIALEADGKTPIRREIRVSDIGQVFARFTNGFEHLAALAATRNILREALISRYFPQLSQIKNQKSSIIIHQSPFSRRAAAIQAIGTFAENHQILFLTYHPDQAGELQSQAGARHCRRTPTKR